MVGDRARRGLAGSRFARVDWVADIDSTNAALLARARDGEPEGAVLVADHQRAGRGRLGRTWIAPPGASLLVSWLVRPELEPGRLHLLTIAAALATADACAAGAGVAPRLKWPNDVQVGSRKVAGILAESVVEQGRVAAVVVGVGVNVNWPAELPDEIAETATALNLEAGHDVDREDVLVELLRGFERRYPPSPGLLQEYRERCTTVDQTVRVHTPSVTIVGRAQSIDDDGRLVVLGGDGVRRTFTAADVVHLRPA